jgi:hypothetical protein
MIIDNRNGIRFRSGTDAEILTGFGADWDPSVGPIERTASLLANAIRNEDIDVTALPINAAAIIRTAWIAFKTSGLGAVGMAINMSVLALRDKDGLLSILSDSFSANAVVCGGADPLVGLTGLTAPDNNTIRLAITNGNNTTAWRFRYVLSIVPADAVVNAIT